ncbi:MAG: hypothetical protein HYY06_02325 [Deltaproteobacteria bacterium]|nr:hypothetical protein [Deltaproteobacteria bacterium]
MEPANRWALPRERQPARAAALAALTLAVSCARPEPHYAEFVRTRQLQARSRPGYAVRVLSRRPPSSQFLDVGLVSSEGDTFQDAVKRARWEAGVRGCDAFVVTARDVTRSGWAAFTSTAQTVAGLCLVRLPRTRAPAAPGRTDRACRPPCRQGFDCDEAGVCAPACNPPCPSDRDCMGHGSSAYCAPLAAPAPPPPPAASPQEGTAPPPAVSEPPDS